MTLPNGFLDELRTRLSIADIVGRKVIWDARKTQVGKGEYWAPCPFHQEKTPSFKVDDKKGFYYCFGCQAKGDMITFVRETENLGFMEAVTSLAQEAGMPVPTSDPRAKEKADRATHIIEVCEMAARWFRLQLQTRQGESARAYLKRRGLTEQRLAQFGIGYAPDRYTALQEHLAQKGTPPHLIAAAGLSKTKDGGKPYDVFRGRIMFPIQDARGRTIAFGGRALDPDVPAKYLNSPETELFRKSHTLYNHAPARRATADGHPLIVAEGYMDVIALVDGGFEASVACLGTALTENHLTLLWKMADEPILALDGDAAGLRAAQRIVDLALPLLQPGKSLRFAVLPKGQDPDDLLRTFNGPVAMQEIISAAQPLIDMLWHRIRQDHNLDTPERRAAFDKDLRQAVQRIGDRTIRHHYAAAIHTKREELYALSRQHRKSSHRKAAPLMGPYDATKALAKKASAEDLLEVTALALLLRHPVFVEEHIDDLENHRWSCAFYNDLAQAILALPEGCIPAQGWKILEEQFSAAELETLLAHGHIKINPAFRAETTHDEAQACFKDVMHKLKARQGYAQEMREALDNVKTLQSDFIDTATWRVANAATIREDVYRIRSDDHLKTAKDAEEVSNYLQNLIDNRVWEKKKS